MIKLYETATKSTYKDKIILINGNHNTSWMIDQNRYFAKIKEFLIKS